MYSHEHSSQRALQLRSGTRTHILIHIKLGIEPSSLMKGHCPLWYPNLQNLLRRGSRRGNRGRHRSHKLDRAEAQESIDVEGEDANSRLAGHELAFQKGG